MSLEATVYRLVCDKCHGAWISPIGLSVTDARKAARLAGWTGDASVQDRCPRCTRTLTRGAQDDPAPVGGVGS